MEEGNINAHWKCIEFPFLPTFFSLLHSSFLHCHFFLLLLVECNQSLRDEKWKMRMAEEEKCRKTILPRRRTQDENAHKNFFTINCKEFQSEAPQTFSLKLIVCDFSQKSEWIESLSRLRGQLTSHESFVLSIRDFCSRPDNQFELFPSFS